MKASLRLDLAADVAAGELVIAHTSLHLTRRRGVRRLGAAAGVYDTATAAVYTMASRALAPGICAGRRLERDELRHLGRLRR